MQSFKRCLNYDLQNNITRGTSNIIYVIAEIKKNIPNNNKINNSVSPPFEML